MDVSDDVMKNGKRGERWRGVVRTAGTGTIAYGFIMKIKA
jgi:hypothetical protein